jgi:hypothetical protein
VFRTFEQEDVCVDVTGGVLAHLRDKQGKEWWGAKDCGENQGKEGWGGEQQDVLV